MNLMSFLGRGAAMAPKPPAHSRELLRATEAARRQWLNALLVDQTRAWMSLGERQPDLLNAMAAMLTIAGMVHTYDARRADTPDMRVIRGAISAATQCAAAGGLITAAEAGAFRAACDRATAIVEAGSVDAIIHAASEIRKTVGL